MPMARINLSVRIEHVIVPECYNVFILRKLLTHSIKEFLSNIHKIEKSILSNTQRGLHCINLRLRSVTTSQSKAHPSILHVSCSLESCNSINLLALGSSSKSLSLSSTPSPISSSTPRATLARLSFSLRAIYIPPPSMC